MTVKIVNNFFNVIVQSFNWCHNAGKLKTHLYFSELNIMKGICSRSFEKQQVISIVFNGKMSKSCVKADEKKKREEKWFSWFYHSSIFFSTRRLRKRKLNNKRGIATLCLSLHITYLLKTISDWTCHFVHFVKIKSLNHFFN